MVKFERCDKCGRLSGLQLHLEFGRWRIGWSVHLRRDELLCAAADNHVASTAPPYDYDADTPTLSLHYHVVHNGNIIPCLDNKPEHIGHDGYLFPTFASAEAFARVQASS